MDIDIGQFRGKIVLVVGATGFIGSHLMGALQRLGADAVGLSRSTDAGAQRGWRACDASDPQQLAEAFDAVRPEIVYQLTSDSRGGQELALVADSIRNDLLATVNVLTEATRAGVGRVVILGSLEEPKGDAAAATPSSPYAAAKWSSCAYARMFARLYGLPVTVLRLMMIYGPGQKPYKVVPYTIQALLAGEDVALTNAERRLDWIYIDDAIDAILRAGLAPAADAQSIDIGSGDSILLRDLLAEIGEQVGRSELLKFGSLPGRVGEREEAADPGAALAKLGWQARTPLAEGLRRTIAAYRGSAAALLQISALQSCLPLAVL